MASSTPLDRSSLFSCEGLIVVITGGGTGNPPILIHKLSPNNPHSPPPTQDNSPKEVNKTNTGIGLSMTRALAQNGATVYIIGRRLETLTAAAASVNSTPTSPSTTPPNTSNETPDQANGHPGLKMGKVIPIQADVTSPASLAAAASTIASSSGHINLLIANAGILGPTNRALLPATPQTMSIEEVQSHLSSIPIESFTETCTVNVTGALYTSIAFLSLLDQGNRKGGVRQTSQILVTSSIGGFHRGWTQGGLAYNTSKAAVTHLVKSLAGFLIGWGIRVNGLAPGREFFFIFILGLSLLFWGVFYVSCVWGAERRG